ncbi:hypothetical protein [Pseudomonas sp. MWU12-2323]|uniref:hypothetical protein n=1 Tax=Pseudomonas sp. MWU12-2323 TaxID=2651296 RepID=UPI00128B1166|nr:hypothetical protein [Pseudomonas sp. MWU12-2323]MPQ69336.1 hypothetical protein [Pseudomonas sp. MWU12-2323]
MPRYLGNERALIWISKNTEKWFALIGGTLAIAFITPVWGSFGLVGNIVAALASVASVAAIFRGWLVLSIAAKEQTGAWPAWGFFTALPWIIGFVVVVFFSISLAYVAYWAGQQFEKASLEVIPSKADWRFWLSKTGYVMAGCMVTWQLPRLFKQVWLNAKSYSDNGIK